MLKPATELCHLPSAQDGKISNERCLKQDGMRGTGSHSRQQVNARMPGGKSPGSVYERLQARRFSGHGHCERGQPQMTRDREQKARHAQRLKRTT